MFYLASKTERYAPDENGFCRPCSSSDLSSVDSNGARMPRSVTFTACNEYFEKEHPMHQRRIGFKRFASQIILQVPVEQIRKIKETEGIGSISRETQHFSQTTTMHGPKRIYQGKRLAMYFWILMVLCSGILLCYQVSTLIKMYVSNPTVSQVSFLINEKGMDFPAVTICNFNPIKKSYIKKLNASGDFSDHLLEYLIESLMDTRALYGNADRAQLHVGDRALQVYQESHPNFTITGFFNEAGFNCSETMKLCMFIGRQFDCCKYMRPTMTNMGNCHTLDMRGARNWMQKQTVSGVNAGLQIFLDAHMEEQFDGTGDGTEPPFTNGYENGFRYYVHPPETIPYLVSEGISVSPGTKVYSAISTEMYVLLSPEDWGNCSDAWPASYSTTLPYSAVNCNSLCNARFFHDRCGCSPFTYNIDASFPLCTPYQSFQCIDQHIRNGTENFNLPPCQECKVECNSLAYHAYNSYGHGFSHGALKYLHHKNPEWTKAHIRSNFVIMSVFFRDMAHTEYRQIQATSLTEILSDIGGNMGMFLGMSLITVTELSLFISKIGWIAFSKRRRDYLFNKKKREQEREKQLEETMSTFSALRTRKNGGISDSVRVTQSRLRSLSQQIRDSFRKSSKPQGTTAPTPALEKVETGTCTDLPEKMLEEQRKQFDDIVNNKSAYRDRTLSNPESMIELQIDLRDLKRKLDRGLPVGIKRRRRATTAPPAPRGVKVAPMLAHCGAKLSAFVPFHTENSKDLRLHRESM
ncbi:hypothetical protein Aduo_001006 [Ancylostoma duodenale]